MNQTQINFSIAETNKGINKAVDHADAVHPNWKDLAFNFLKDYIKSNPSFMCEDLRYASQGIVPTPPHLRSWGFIIQMAAKAGLIRHVRYQKVKSASSHRANASVWHTV